MTWKKGIQCHGCAWKSTDWGHTMMCNRFLMTGVQRREEDGKCLDYLPYKTRRLVVNGHLAGFIIDGKLNGGIECPPDMEAYVLRSLKGCAIGTERRFSEKKKVAVTKLWGDDDLAKLRELLALEPVPRFEDMAQVLGKSEGAVRHKAAEMGYKPGYVNKWTLEDEILLMDMVSAGKTTAECAEHFGRSRKGILRKLVDLRDRRERYAG